MRGIAYQQDFSSNGTISGTTKYIDPLADPDVCARDIPYLQEIRTNTIRVYAIDPEKDHSDCMQMLQEAGIYVIADLGEPANSINRDAPQWNMEIYDRYVKVVDDLQQYSNVFGFFAGNEVSNSPNNTVASAFVKAAVRDVKAYIAAKKYRKIGVGYATNDDETRTNLANYFNCGSPEESIDFWGYNIYSWCGNSDMRRSKFTERTKEFSTYNVPAFFAEYGCNDVQPRKFTEIEALFGPEMTPVWSGGIMYMYFQETNDYGIVTVGANDKVTKLPDFTAYSSQMAKVTPTGVNSAEYTPTNTVARACPTIGPSWEAVAQLPPAPDSEICSCMVQNLTCIANPNLSDKAIKTQYDYVCDKRNSNSCEGIEADAKNGTYGAYSMCSVIDRLSWAFNTYYLNQTENNPDNNNPCDFNGAGKIQNPSPASSCSAAITRAGADGNGIVTAGPSPSGTGSRSSNSDEGAASSVTIPNYSFGILITYLVVAALTGGGMILL
jgi:hypothetical protein